MYTIDASVIITATEPHEADHAACLMLLQRLHARSVPVFLPLLAFAEVGGFVSRTRDAERARRILALIGRMRGLKSVPLDIALSDRAAEIAVSRRLRGADAVYAAVAQSYATTLVSRDREHLTRLVSVVPVLDPAAALTQL